MSLTVLVVLGCLAVLVAGTYVLGDGPVAFWKAGLKLIKDTWTNWRT